MGKLLYENFLRDVWCRNESVRAEIGNILQTHASKLVVEILTVCCNMFFLHTRVKTNTFLTAVPSTKSDSILLSSRGCHCTIFVASKPIRDTT